MDPRLWQTVNLTPGELYVQNVKISHVESTLTLECKAFHDTYPKGKNIYITFKNCRDIRWQAVDPHAGEEAMQALGIFLGEHCHGKPAVVYTGATELSVLYNEVRIST